ncbi:MAG TPA: hypothetical protein VLR89_05475 [Anaerolineaceae bacterium]|nr:hypothetical protein [Anaerolineaceae bacterium]
MKKPIIYRLDQKKFPHERLTILRMYWATIILLIIGAFAFITLRKLPLSALWWLPIIAGLLIYYMSNAVQKAQRTFDEFTLEWDGETIKQNTPGMPELVLKAEEIANLELTRQGLEISSLKHQNVLTVPANMAEADLAELKNALSQAASSLQK